ncbi:putative solute carrier family 17 member 9 isoform X3 [Apostichopus japonicus]|uniref:Putative solute carrier family 17 member 9 isoform X3 n=1 Tax=Stichopus japonicus TaxID=307972 RepID=A0A2G8LI05_STIJA|nr:putative solute carrier family 17 member 9 isoform X3 [Apostichopus japonicus]
MEEPLIVRDLQITVTTPTEDTSSKWNKSDRKLWTGLLFIATSLTFAGRTIMPLVAVKVGDEFGWNKEQSGIVLGAFFWGYPFFQIIGGIVSDRIGGDYVLYRATLIWSVIAIITPQVPYYYHTKRGTISAMAFMRFLMGLTQGVHYPSVSSLIGQRVTISHKATTVGIVFSASSCGTLFTGSVGSILLERYNWRIVFYTIGGLGVVSAFILRYFAKRQTKRLNVRELSSNRREKSKVQSKDALKQLSRHRAFWALLVSHSSGVFVFFILVNWFPTYFTESFPDAKSWIFNVIPWIVALPGSIGAGWLADSLIGRKYSVATSRKFIHTLSCLGLAFPLFLIGYSRSFTFSLILAAIALFGQALSNGGTPVNPNDIAPSHAGMVFGIINTVAAVQGFTGTYLAGYILHMTESWSRVFSMAGGVTLLSWLVFVIYGQGTSIID